VAKAAGVSPAIVSRVINDDQSLRVRPDTRRRVLSAAKALEYTPNRAARALRLASSGALCLVAHHVAHPLHGETLRGAQMRAGRAGYVVLLGDAEELAHNPQSYENLLAARRVDGLVLHLSGGSSDARLRRLAEARLPTVLINSRMRGRGSVILDDEAAAALAAEHLLELGHTRIGFVSGITASDRSQRRRRGLEAVLEQHGLELRPDWILDGGWDEPAGHRAVVRLLRRRSRPTAIVVANVLAGIGALAACRERGVEVPRDLSVVAIHDTWFTDHTNPPLTTVKTPLQEMGAAAVDLLVEMLNGGGRRSIVLREPPAELMLRASTGRPPR
jgi:LacI family transcriptional regulator